MKTTLYLLHGEGYNDNVLETLQTTISPKTKVVYVTLNKTYLSIKESFFHLMLPYDNYYFVDACTPRLFKNITPVACMLVEHIEELSKLREAIFTAIRIHRPSVIVLDSLSTLLTYVSDRQIQQFLDELNAFLKRQEINMTIFALYDDRDKPTVKRAASTADKTILPTMVVRR